MKAFIGEWGDEAGSLLKAIRGTHRKRKINTIMRLAIITLNDGTRQSVWRDPACGSGTAHRKWMEGDERYRLAYEFIVGNRPSDPYSEGNGLAWKRRIAAEDARLDAAIKNVGEAMFETMENALSAVQVQIEIMNDVDIHAKERLRAAEGVIKAARETVDRIEGGANV